VRLYVGVLGFEQLARKVDGVLLDLVGELAPSVPALAGWVKNVSS
jgi:hypothetical protein